MKKSKRIFKTVLKTIGVLFLVMTALFLISVFKTNYNKTFLNKLDAEILYMKPDKNWVRSIYKAKLGGQDEELLVASKGENDTNGNVIDMVYNSDKNKIFYMTENVDGSKIFEFDLNNKTTKVLPDMEHKVVSDMYLFLNKNVLVYSSSKRSTLIEPVDNEEDKIKESEKIDESDDTLKYYYYDFDKNNITEIKQSEFEKYKDNNELMLETSDVNAPMKSEDGKYSVTDNRGNIYLQNNVTKERKIIKKYYGIYEPKFSPGYIPLQIVDNKYLVYDRSKHLTPIGQILEILLFQRDPYATEIVDLETGETSQYINHVSYIYQLK
jgi:Tol biopolymer transport system component